MTMVHFFGGMSSGCFDVIRGFLLLDFMVYQVVGFGFVVH